MAYSRDCHDHPRSIRELVQRLGRRTSQSQNITEPPPTAASVHASVQEEMGSRFAQCGPGSTRSLRRLRVTPYSQHPRTRATKVVGRSFTRTIFLLNQQDFLLPRGYERQNMYEEGRVVDFVELHTSWSDDRVRRAIEEVFSNVLTGTATPRYVN